VTGQKLSHYEVLESLGAGGMGEVYRARDSKLGRDVAIKVLSRDRAFSNNARRRFQREAMAASALNHPNIITIHEINSQDDIDFIVMEYVRGASLNTLMRKSRIPVPQVLRYGVQIADGVAKAHTAGIIHRDLKPGNVMITVDGLVKVLDFGVAKFSVVESDETVDAGALPETNLTLPGTTSGTLAYMSPEQARGETVDFRSDIFSFGVILFQLLSGEFPFAGTNTMALLHNLHFNPPRDLTNLCPDAPKALVTLVSRMLEKQPAKRIQTMQEVATELRGIARTQQWSLSQESAMAATAVDYVPTPQPRSYLPGNRRLWIAAAVLALLVVTIAGGRLLLKRRAVTQTIVSEDTPVDDNAYALYKSARNYLDHYERAGNVDKAVKLLERGVQLDPKSAVSYAALSEAYFRKNRENPDPQWSKLSAGYAHQAVEIDGELALGHVALGVSEMQAGHAGESEKQFSLAASLDPKSEAPHRWLGWMYDKTQSSKQAAEELHRALELGPNNWQTYMELGLNAYSGSNYKEAADNWEHALKLEPDNVPALENLGAVYHMLDRDDDAASALQRSLEIKPSADGYNNLGYIRFYQGHYQDAVAAFEKTVALGANNYDNWANLADAYRWTPRNQAKAKQAYEHAIELLRTEITKNPKDVDMKATLATYLAKLGEKDEALQQLKLVEQAPKKEAQTWFRSTIVYELCGQRQQALNALAEAVKKGQPLADIQTEPELVALRADPQYHLKILARYSSSANH
jgi:serine/threonine-protein kinase